MIRQLEIENFGPIQHGSVTFGDLTVLVGHQAAGKSLFTQLVKAVSDAGAIRADLTQYGYQWLREREPLASFSGLYFGGGLEDLLAGKSKLRVNGKARAWMSLAKPGGNSSKEETVFLVPAQRVVVLQDGWPRPFMAYLGDDPYCMRRFSEQLRTVMDGFDTAQPVFPRPRLLRSTLRKTVVDSIYAGFELRLAHGRRKQLVLSPGKKARGLPLNVWSAGQREFTPLLLSMYWLMPSTQAERRGAVDHVIIEEPEMGLHPRAIVGFMEFVLALMARGYSVTISTHSPVILDVVFAIENLKKVGAKPALRALKKIFGILGQEFDGALKTSLTKKYRCFFFDRNEEGVEVRDISSLDPSDEDENVSGWGGLSGYSGDIANIVGEALTQAGVE